MRIEKENALTTKWPTLTLFTVEIPVNLHLIQIFLTFPLNLDMNSLFRSIVARNPLGSTLFLWNSILFVCLFEGEKKHWDTVKNLQFSLEIWSRILDRTADFALPKVITVADRKIHRILCYCWGSHIDSQHSLWRLCHPWANMKYYDMFHASPICIACTATDSGSKIYSNSSPNSHFVWLTVDFVSLHKNKPMPLIKMLFVSGERRNAELLTEI